MRLFFNLWFIVNSTHISIGDISTCLIQWWGFFFYKTPSIHRDKASKTHTGAAQDRNRANICVQNVDIGSTTTKMKVDNSLFGINICKNNDPNVILAELVLWQSLHDMLASGRKYE